MNGFRSDSSHAALPLCYRCAGTGVLQHRVRTDRQERAHRDLTEVCFVSGVGKEYYDQGVLFVTDQYA